MLGRLTTVIFATLLGSLSPGGAETPSPLLDGAFAAGADGAVVDGKQPALVQLASDELNPVDRQQVVDFTTQCEMPGGTGTQFDCACLTAAFEAERAKGPERTYGEISDLVLGTPPARCLDSEAARKLTVKSCLRTGKPESRCTCIADAFVAAMQDRPSAIMADRQVYLYNAQLACPR